MRAHLKALALLLTGTALGCEGFVGGPLPVLRDGGTPSQVIPPALPIIDSLWPSEGPSEGGTQVALRGSHFDRAVTVFFGESPSPSVKWIDETLLRVTTPAHAAGLVQVKAANPGQASSGNATFRYSVQTVTKVLSLGTSPLFAKPGESVSLELRFDAAPLDEDYQVLVQCFDAQGRQVSNLDASHAPPISTAVWSGSVQYSQVLEVPAQAMPGPYEIRVGLYRNREPFDRIALAMGEGVSHDGERRYRVGMLEVEPPNPVEPPTTKVLTLGTAALSAKQGEPVSLQLRFEAVPMPEDYRVFVHFVDAAGQRVSGLDATHAPPTATSLWSGLVSYPQTVTLPSDAAPGSYEVRVGLEQTHSPYDRVALTAGDGVRADADLSYRVGTLEIQAKATTAATTKVLTLGASSISAKAGEPVSLQMRFEAVPMAADYVVFVHFVDAQGQHFASMNADHTPPSGTSTWSGPVSYSHSKTIPATAAPGTYEIRVGLYQSQPPYERVALSAGPGVTVDGELRYRVGTLQLSAGSIAPPPPGGAVFEGRFDWRDAAGPRCAWTYCSFTTGFIGSSLDVELDGASGIAFQVVVDGAPTRAFKTTGGRATYRVAGGLGGGAHTASVYRKSEAEFGVIQFLRFIPISGGSLTASPAPSSRSIELIGDSATVGYGNEGCPYGTDTENGYLTYGAIAARAVGAQAHIEAWTGRGMYRNYGGDRWGTLPSLFDLALPDDGTSGWSFSQYVPQAVVVNLGANDFNLGDPGQIFVDTYVGFLHHLRDVYPQALILCVVYPGREHFERVEQAVAQAADPRVKQFDLSVPDYDGCNGHPSVAAHQAMGASLATRLRQELGW